MPGDVFSSQSRGCNNLIKDGAGIFTNIGDLLNSIPFKIKKKENVIKMAKRGKFRD